MRLWLQMEWINQIAKHHSEWVRVVNTFGEQFYAEDVVQEVYIRLMNYSREEQCIVSGEINRAYMYYVLRNTYLIINRNYKPQFVSIDNAFGLAADNPNLLDAYKELEHSIDGEVAKWHWYDQRVWDIHREQQLSIRKIADKTKISSKSIFNTLKSCKHRLREAVQEQWDNYKENE